MAPVKVMPNFLELDAWLSEKLSLPVALSFIVYTLTPQFLLASNLGQHLPYLYLGAMNHHYPHLTVSQLQLNIYGIY